MNIKYDITALFNKAIYFIEEFKSSLYLDFNLKYSHFILPFINFISDNSIIWLTFVIVNLGFINFRLYSMAKNYQKKFLIFFINLAHWIFQFTIMLKFSYVNFIYVIGLLLYSHWVLFYFLMNWKKILFFYFRNKKSFQFINLIQAALCTKVAFKLISLNLYQKLVILGLFYFIFSILIILFRKKVNQLVSKLLSIDFIVWSLFLYFQIKELVLRFSEFYYKKNVSDKTNLYVFFYEVSFYILMIFRAFVIIAIFVCDNFLLSLCLYFYSLFKVIDRIIFHEIKFVQIEDDSFYSLIQFSKLKIVSKNHLLKSPLFNRYQLPFNVRTMMLKAGAENPQIKEGAKKLLKAGTTSQGGGNYNSGSSNSGEFFREGFKAAGGVAVTAIVFDRWNEYDKRQHELNMKIQEDKTNVRLAEINQTNHTKQAQQFQTDHSKIAQIIETQNKQNERLDNLEKKNNALLSINIGSQNTIETKVENTVKTTLDTEINTKLSPQENSDIDTDLDDES